MKTNIPKNIFIPFVLFLCLFVFSSDIIPDNSHEVERTVVISNCNDFPELNFVACINSVMGGDEFYYLVQANTPLYKGYKFNALYIFGIKKTILQQLGGVEQLTSDYVFEKVRYREILSSGTYYIDNSLLLEKEDLNYVMEKDANGDLFARLKERTVFFQDGTSKTLAY